MTTQQQRRTTIQTPDQRVRVFVSSTLGELADERTAVARAISALRLTPVLFELGARPHPPQELYRTYLAQSDIFIGIYWQRYGWIGPDMEISGLQDEYELARSLPRLLYVKVPAPDRELRLTGLLERFKSEAANSYRTFRTARELGRLVRDDLALVLSERFATGSSAAAESSRPAGRRARRSLPVATTSLIGRQHEIEEVCRLLERPEVRLVTLTGPGGIGKTRLAMAVAERLTGPDGTGTAFVPLASIADPALVRPSIAAAVGAAMEGARSPLEALVEHFSDTSFLLVLDNLEQVVDVAADLSELLFRCPGVKILATSRTALQLRAEHDYPVPALAVPSDPSGSWIEQPASSPAVGLFVDRAGAVRHDFALTERNAVTVAEICRRLEGLPLAIELAAARIRLLDPAALLARLTSRLDALGTGPVDLPERQRTLRATVDWSIGLLDTVERRMLVTLAAFVEGWTIEAAARVSNLGEDSTLDLIDALARHSLVQVAATDDRRRFSMLETVREFAAEQLTTDPDFADVERRHAEYFHALVERADQPLRGLGQTEWADRLQEENGNLRAAIRWFLTQDSDRLAHLFRVLWLFWWLRDHLVEGRAWVEELLPRAATLDDQAQAELLWTAAVTAVEVGDDAAARAALDRLSPLVGRVDDPYIVGILHLATSWILPIVDDFDGALRAASLALQCLREQDEPFMTALAVNTLGFVETAVGHYEEALRHLTELHELGERFGNNWLIAGSRAQLGTIAVVQGRLDDARALLDEGLSLSLEAQSTHGLTFCLMAVARLALVEGSPHRAAIALGAAEGLRSRAGLRVWPLVRRDEAELHTQMKEALGPDRFAEAFAAGSALSRRAAVATVRSWDVGKLP